MVTIKESKNGLTAGTLSGKVILVYEDNPEWVRSKGQELWNMGCDVWVEAYEERYQFLDYIIATQVHPDEAIQAVVDWYLAQKAAGRRYRAALQRLTRHIAYETKQSVTGVRTRFKELRPRGLDF